MRFLRPLVVAVIVLLVSYGSVCAAEKEGRPASDFTLRDLGNKKVTLSDLYGDGPILISLWALWCRPCLEELPHLDKMYREYKDRGLQVLAVSQDSPRSLNKVKSYIKSRKYALRVLTDSNADLTRKFKTKLIPYTLILDSEGDIVYSRTGYRKGQEKELEEIVLGLLKDTQEHEID
ncbi:MAG: TlpA family protein disulfide reductase [Candidatus Eisenbacteria sp.]|nr:TlpA family protein disulfide reductase [Candidatus Eisenbacteria bacterium]